MKQSQKNRDNIDMRYCYSKPLLDLLLSVCILPFLLPLLVIISVVILIIDGRPVLYPSERMKTPTQGFILYKFRTMQTSLDHSTVTGPDKSHMITRSGFLLRKTKLDELPQIFNVIRGDISFIGPRPPLRAIVETFPEIYQTVLKNKPGISGLASLVFGRHETRLLKDCVTSTDTMEVYGRLCVPRKAKLDAIYQRHQSMCFDIYLMAWTLSSIFKSGK